MGFSRNMQTAYWRVFPVRILNGRKTKGKPQRNKVGNTMKLTFGQAAKTANRAKGTLSKALNSGVISAEKDDKGRRQIDPSELSQWMSANPFPNSLVAHLPRYAGAHGRSI